MKTIAMIPLALLLAGCTVTEFTKEGGLKRTSFLQSSRIGYVKVTGGDVEMKGYENDGGKETLSAAIEAAVTAAIKSATSIP